MSEIIQPEPEETSPEPVLLGDLEMIDLFRQSNNRCAALASHAAAAGDVESARLLGVAVMGTAWAAYGMFLAAKDNGRLPLDTQMPAPPGWDDYHTRRIILR